MNLVIDYGNSQVKAGIFEGLKLKKKYVFANEEDFLSFSNTSKYDHAIMSSVVQLTEPLFDRVAVKGKKIKLTHRTPLPIHLSYNTPKTLGTDRIAIACGAIEKVPKRDCLAIGMGTCITFDFVNAQSTYFGGSLSPGVKMRYRAMHTFTSKLPLLAPRYAVDLISYSTTESIHSGVINGVIAEIEGIVNRYRKKFPTLEVIVCGGDSLFFEKKFMVNVLFIPDLVLSGLNNILLYNVGV